MGKRKSEAEGGTKVARPRDPLLVAASRLAMAKREKERLEAKVEKLSRAKADAMAELDAAGAEFDKAKAELTGE